MPSIRAFVYAAVRDSSIADDLVQDTAVAVMTKIDDFEPGTDFLAWAITIARYEVLALRRRQSRDERFLSDTVLDNLAIAIAEVRDEGDRRQAAMRHCINQLPESQRRILDRRYQTNQSITKMAEEGGVSPNSLAVTLHRIRVALRQCIDRRIQLEDA